MPYRVEQRAISSLAPYEHNARTHSAAQVALIAASIGEFGWTNPVLVDEAGQIIAGHGRVLAATQLGMEQVPVVILDHLTEQQKRALVIADNQLALNAGWETEILESEIRALELDEFDLALLGFSDDELKPYLGAADEAGLPVLASGDRQPFRQVTFTLHDDQYEQLQEALAEAKAIGPFVGSENENSNGNALARVCELFLHLNGGSHAVSEGRAHCVD